MARFIRMLLKRRDDSRYSRKMWNIYDSHNAAMDKQYKLGVNEFADIPNEEFKC